MTYDREGEIPCPDCQALFSAPYIRRWGNCDDCNRKEPQQRYRQMSEQTAKASPEIKDLVKRIFEIEAWPGQPMIDHAEQLIQANSIPVSSIPCCRCEGSVYEFSIPNDIWNLIIRQGGPETDKEYLCWSCFASAAVDLIDSQAAEIERLKITNEHWHMRVEQLKTDNEAWINRDEEKDAELSRLREVVGAAKKLNEPDAEVGEDGITAVMYLLAPVADRFHPDLANLATAVERLKLPAAQQTGGSGD